MLEKKKTAITPDYVLMFDDISTVQIKFVA